MQIRACYRYIKKMRNSFKRNRGLASVVTILLVLMAIPGMVAAGKESCIDLTKVTPSDKMVFAVKQDAPLIIIDLGPELEFLEPLDESCRRVYVQKRVLATVVQHGLDREAFHGFERFVVKAVIVVDFDNYDQPQWFSAPQLATIEVNRQKVTNLTVSTIHIMADGTLTDYLKILKMDVSDLDY